MSDPSAQNYFKIETQRQNQIDKFVLDFHQKEKDLYQTERNKHAKPPKFSVGDVVLLRNLAPPRQGEMPLKYLAPYKHNLYIVHYVRDLLCVLFNPVSGVFLYHNTQHIKLYRPRRGDIFDKLRPDLRKIIGAPFDPYSRKTRAELIEYIQTLRMTDTDDSDGPLPPSLPPSIEPEPLPPDSSPPPPPILSLPLDEFYDTSSEVSTSPDLADFDSPASNYQGPPPLFDPPAPTPVGPIIPPTQPRTVLTRLKTALRSFRK